MRQRWSAQAQIASAMGCHQWPGITAAMMPPPLRASPSPIREYCPSGCCPKLKRTQPHSFAGAWPGREAAGEADAEFARKLGDMRKIVVSQRPLEFTWRNSEQLPGSLAEGAAALKADPSIGRIALSGSVSVVRQLLAAGLLDELHLFVHPALAGSGLRLFPDEGPGQPLRLLSSQPFATGVLYLVYAPDPNPPAGHYEQAKQNLPKSDLTHALP